MRLLKMLGSIAMMAMLVFGAMALTLASCEMPEEDALTTPVANPKGGTYTSTQLVGLSATPVDAKIYYTLDGTEPSASSTLYASPISISSTTTLKAIAVKDDKSSGILTAQYTINVSGPTVAMPTASPAAGTYFSAQSVTLATTTSGADIYYTLDGTNPTTSSTKYTTAISIAATTTLKAIGVKAGNNNSNVLTALYTITTFAAATANATELTIAQWKDGNIATTASPKEQWFKFTATAANAYIHFSTTGTMPSVYVTLYDKDGNVTGTARTNMGSITSNTNRTGLTSGQVYYIKVEPGLLYNGGTYKIGFNTANSMPVDLPDDADVTTLSTADTWQDGDIATAGGEQWFKFTATAAPQYVYFHADTLNDVKMSVYKTNGEAVGTVDTRLSGVNLSLNRSAANGITVNDAYYIKVTPYGSSGGTESGNYKIAFGGSTRPVITPPTAGVTTLTADAWGEGNIAAAGGEQWYKFSATATSHYVHFNPKTLANVIVEVYTSTGTFVGSASSLTAASPNVSRTGLAASSDFYIRARPSAKTSGAFQIAFNSAAVSPAKDGIPPAGVTPTNIAAIDTWADGNITTAGGEQWFKFQATAASLYIHFDFGGLHDVLVELYDTAGKLYGSRANLYTNGGLGSLRPAVNWTGLTSGTDYYIKVTPDSTTLTGNFKIAFAADATRPATTTPTGANVTALLTGNKWTSGEISATAAIRQQWFSFTATQTTQYFHFSANTSGIAGTLTDVYLWLYDEDGKIVGTGATTATTMTTTPKEVYYSTLYVRSTALEVGKTYYVRIWPYDATASTASLSRGTFRLGLSEASDRTALTLP